MVCGDTPNLTMTTILELTLSTQVSNSSSSVIPWVPPYHSCILLDLNLLTQVKPGTSSSPVATSANSSGSKADATYLSSVWRTNPARVASREKSWAEWRELEPLALSLRLLAALEAWAAVQQGLEETVLTWFHDHPGCEAACGLQSDRHFVALAFELYAGIRRAGALLPTGRSDVLPLPPIFERAALR